MLGMAVKYLRKVAPRVVHGFIPIKQLSLLDNVFFISNKNDFFRGNFKLFIHESCSFIGGMLWVKGDIFSVYFHFYHSIFCFLSFNGFVDFFH